MDENIYFNPGQVVMLKLDIPNKPKMVVIKKETSLFKHIPEASKKSILIGIRCMWFTDSKELLEAIFNTKDLVLVE